MSIWDGDGTGFNILFPTLGGKVYWSEEAAACGYRLQRLKWLPDHWRILDEDDFRVANGTESQMRAEFRRLTSPGGVVTPQYGDVIGVHRVGGVYDHYGIYESDDCIYEYGVRADIFDPADIHTTTMKEFTRESKSCFVLEFPERYGKPGKVDISVRPMWGGQTIVSLLSVVPNLWELLEEVFTSPDYHLYTPEETIRRARSRLGEQDYNLMTNNCEHFAIWCKTGIHESHQVKSLLGVLNRFHLQSLF